MAWGPVIVQLIGSAFGLLALIGLLALSWHMSDHGQGPEAASVVTSGAVSIVTIFVTGKVLQGRWSRHTSTEDAATK